MHSLLHMIVALVIWGLFPASLHVFMQLQIAREAEKRTRLTKERLRKARLREWRARVPKVTRQWPREAHMGTICQCEATLWHISYARDDALAQEITTCAQRALNSAPHIHN